MTSFFTILFILLGANAVFMLFGLSGASRKETKAIEEAPDSSTSKVYPIDMDSNKFKKAV